MRYARYAYETLRGTDDHRTVAGASLLIGANLARLGQPRSAIEWLQNAVATFRRIDDADGLVGALNHLGVIYKNLR